MPKKKRIVSRRRGRKSKLRKGTIYNLFAFGLIVGALLCFASFLKQGGIFLSLSDHLTGYFGVTKYLVPLLLLLLGFLLLRLNFFLSSPNLAVGFLLIFVALSGFLKAGNAGNAIASMLTNLIGS